MPFIGSFNDLEVGLESIYSGENKNIKNNDDLEKDDIDFDLDQYTDDTPTFRKLARQISQLSINNIPDNVKKRVNILSSLLIVICYRILSRTLCVVATAIRGKLS